MIRTTLPCGITVMCLAVCASAQTNLDPLDNWAQWRGPLGTGVAPRGTPPTQWSESENIRWKVPISGTGHSTPVVWGDRLFLTTARRVGDPVDISHAHRPGSHDNVNPTHQLEFVVLAIRRTDGATLWERTVRTGRPHEGMHETASWASASPVTDGEYVIASFGSRGLFGLSLTGELLWEVNLGDMHTKHGHGEGSSPGLFGDTVVVNWDHEGESFLVALDKRTGATKWRVSRDEATSWSSPLIVEVDSKPQVIVSATNRVRAYDLTNGEIIWECGGLSSNVVATPVASGGMVFVGNSYDAKAMLAIRLAGARGDITGTDAVVWTRNRHTPYVPSPVLYENTLCFLRHYQGYLTCVDARDGAVLFGPKRLPDITNVYASLVAAAGRIYVVDRHGTTVVVGVGPRFEILATNRLHDSFSASPVIVDSALFLRGERFLYCIETVSGRASSRSGGNASPRVPSPHRGGN